MPAATPARPRALVVFESMFGHTEAVASEIADRLTEAGLVVTLRGVEDPSVPSGELDVELVAAGAPTHGFTLSRPSTRAAAVEQGAPAEKRRTGLREWLAHVVPAPAHPVAFVAFDTRVEKVRMLPFAAGPRASRLARKQGFSTPVKPGAFLVRDTTGPLLDTELSRARAWAASVVDAVRPVAWGSSPEPDLP